MNIKKKLKQKGIRIRRGWVLEKTPPELQRQQALPAVLPAPAREAERLSRGAASHREMARWIDHYLEETPAPQYADEYREVASRFEKFQTALDLMRESRHGDAIAVLQEIAASKSDDWLARLNLAQCLLSTGQFESALMLLDEIGPVYEHHVRYIMMRARALVGLNRREEGCKLLHDLLARQPKNLSIQQELIRLGELIPVEQDANDITRTKYLPRTKYIELLHRESERFEKEKNVEALQALTKNQLEAGFHAVAASIGRRLLNVAPDSIEGRLTTASAESRAGEYPAAENNFKLVLEKEPANLRALAGLAFVLAQTQRKDQAREVLNQAIELDPNFVQAAEMYVLLNDEDEGRFAAAREIKQRFPDAWLPTKLLGDLDVRFGMVEEALAKHQQAYQQSNSDEALTMILHDLDRLNRLDEAIGLIEQMTQLSQRSMTVRWNAANIYLKAGKLNKAATILQAIVRDRALPPETRYSANLLLNEIYSAG